MAAADPDLEYTFIRNIPEKPTEYTKFGAWVLQVFEQMCTVARAAGYEHGLPIHLPSEHAGCVVSAYVASLRPENRAIIKDLIAIAPPHGVLGLIEEAEPLVSLRSKDRLAGKSLALPTFPDASTFEQHRFEAVLPFSNFYYPIVRLHAVQTVGVAAADLMRPPTIADRIFVRAAGVPGGISIRALFRPKSNAAAAKADKEDKDKDADPTPAELEELARTVVTNASKVIKALLSSVSGLQTPVCRSLSRPWISPPASALGMAAFDWAHFLNRRLYGVSHSLLPIPSGALLVSATTRTRFFALFFSELDGSIANTAALGASTLSASAAAAATPEARVAEGFASVADRFAALRAAPATLIPVLVLKTASEPGSPAAIAAATRWAAAAQLFGMFFACEAAAPAPAATFTIHAVQPSGLVARASPILFAPDNVPESSARSAMAQALTVLLEAGGDANRLGTASSHIVPLDAELTLDTLQSGFTYLCNDGLIFEWGPRSAVFAQIVQDSSEKLRLMAASTTMGPEDALALSTVAISQLICPASPVWVAIKLLFVVVGVQAHGAAPPMSLRAELMPTGPLTPVQRLAAIVTARSLLEAAAALLGLPAPSTELGPDMAQALVDPGTDEEPPLVLVKATAGTVAVPDLELGAAPMDTDTSIPLPPPPPRVVQKRKRGEPPSDQQSELQRQLLAIAIRDEMLPGLVGKCLGWLSRKTVVPRLQTTQSKWQAHTMQKAAAVVEAIAKLGRNPSTSALVEGVRECYEDVKGLTRKQGTKRQNGPRKPGSAPKPKKKASARPRDTSSDEDGTSCSSCTSTSSSSSSSSGSSSDSSSSAGPAKKKARAD